MKIDPISTHERSLIIRQLEVCGKWSGERMGAWVHMVRFKTAAGGVVYVTVKLGYVVVTQRCKTVAQACDEVNALVRGRPREPLAGRVVRDPLRTGTPQLVRRRTSRESEGEGLPFGEAS